MNAKTRKKVVVVSGIAGLGLLGLGIWAIWRDHKRGLSGLGRYRQARIVGSYSDGNMKTVMRSDDHMPIEQRIATIQDLIYKSIQDPEMRKLSLRVTSQCPERDQVCEARAIYDYNKRHIRYTGDIGPIVHPDGKIEGIDLYQSARRTHEFGGGDCDDQAIANSTMLAHNGIEAILRVVKQKKAPDWEHIFAVARINGREYALDTTLPGNNNFATEGSYSKRVDFPA